MRPKLTYANVMATVAVFIALGGASYAALKLPKNSVGVKQLKKNSVTTAKIKDQAVTPAKVQNGSLTGAQINATTLGTVPSAQTAQTATTIAPPENWHEVGAPGQPDFQNGWKNFAPALARETVAFFKDQQGMVHLKGVATSGTGIMFTLPVGYRPASGQYLVFLVSCTCAEGKSTGGLVVDGRSVAPGAVLPPGGPSATLEGITFRAES